MPLQQDLDTNSPSPGEEEAHPEGSSADWSTTAVHRYSRGRDGLRRRVRIWLDADARHPVRSRRRRVAETLAVTANNDALCLRTAYYGT
jgi:hypothetical protein